jgi:regulator of protease activity HflC (stomatin/prohibitin superfamily)
VNQIHINWPDDRYRAELVRPLLRSVVRDAVSEFSVETVYQQRQTIDQTITEAVLPAMETEGFIVLDILVRNITFTPEYAQAIEAAQIAEVRIREREFQVQEAEQQAEQVQALARGDAEARKIKALAEAESLQYIADVLADNPDLIQYIYAQNLSDNVQVIGLPATSPFLFDFQSLLNGANQTATPAPVPLGQ